MKRYRKIHLWVGLISSLFLFLQALSGLTIGLFDDEEENESIGITSVAHADEDVEYNGGEKRDDEGVTPTTVAHFIHEGPVGLISSISILILGVTGLYLSVKILGAERKKKQKKMSRAT